MGDSFGFQRNQPINSALFKTRHNNQDCEDWCAELDDVLRSATIRLLQSLRSPDDTRILGPQIVREIIYRVLRGQLGGAISARSPRPTAILDRSAAR